jgi:predicted lactoylglutathione lyase
MAKMIFVNLPVADVARSTAFYEAIGAVPDARFAQGESGAMVSFSDSIHFMLLSHARFADFAPAPLPDGVVSGTALVLISLSEDSRDAIDATVAKAVAAGGKADPTPIEDFGWMYGRSYQDPDGHMIGLSWLDIEAAMAAQQEQVSA